MIKREVTSPAVLLLLLLLLIIMSFTKLVKAATENRTKRQHAEKRTWKEREIKRVIVNSSVLCLRQADASVWNKTLKTSSLSVITLCDLHLVSHTSSCSRPFCLFVSSQFTSLVSSFSLFHLSLCFSGLDSFCFASPHLFFSFILSSSYLVSCASYFIVSAAWSHFISVFTQFFVFFFCFVRSFKILGF